jgi:hypothetical protein
VSPRLGNIPARPTLSPDLSFKNVDNPCGRAGSPNDDYAGNPHLEDADLMTSEQERAFTAWLEAATQAKQSKADRRRKAEDQKEKVKASRPERFAAQNALIEANGGRLPPRWRYETVSKIIGGKRVECIKRIANRPAHISAYHCFRHRCNDRSPPVVRNGKRCPGCQVGGLDRSQSHVEARWLWTDRIKDQCGFLWCSSIEETSLRDWATR